MMRDDTNQILDDLLAKWHEWAKEFAICPQASADPMFRNAKSGRAYETQYEINEQQIAASTMEGVDFEVGEMQEPHRSAIYAHARNLASRHTVWSSPRLPTDAVARALLVTEARSMLMKRLFRAGIM
jgi:hypothetical protein